MEVKDFLKGKFKYDDYGQYIWLVEKDGNHKKIADLRGWGAIQNLFKDNKGAVDFPKAEKFQADLGKWIEQTLNEKMSGDKRGELSEFLEYVESGTHFFEDKDVTVKQVVTEFINKKSS